MSVRRTGVLLVTASLLGFALAAQGADTRAAAPVEKIGALLLRLQENSAVPLIQHCVARLPGLKRSLESEYSQFRKRFRRATAPLLAQIGTNEELSRPAPPELIRQFEEIDAQMLAEVQKLDPQRYCTQLRDNLSSATVESIRKNMEGAYAQYTAAARHSR